MSRRPTVHDGEHDDHIKHPHRGVECILPTPSNLDDVAAVNDAFTDATRGEGAELVDGVLHFETIHNHVVVAWPGNEGWWEARLEVSTDERNPKRVILTVPLKQGPVWYADSDTTMADVVAWLREVTDSSPDSGWCGVCGGEPCDGKAGGCTAVDAQ